MKRDENLKNYVHEKKIIEYDISQLMNSTYVAIPR